MEVYINFQTEDGILESSVDMTEVYLWVGENLRTRGHKTFVVLPDGHNPKDVFITSSPTDIEDFIRYVYCGDKLFIQEFEYGDYENVFGYLQDLFEATPEHPVEVNTLNPN